MSDDIKQNKERLKQFLIDSTAAIHSALSENGKRDFLEEIEEAEKARSEFINKFRTIPLGCESFFAVLRKWNSFTPSLPISNKTALNQFSIGGGYFLYIQGKDDTLDPGYGLVIDPGYNFIHNFGQAGFCLDDIDGILITHAHNDHTNDFESILSLLYQRNGKFVKGKRQKRVDLFLNVGSFKKFSNYLDLTKKRNDETDYINKVIVMSPGQIITVPDRDLDFEMHTLSTDHNEIITKDYSLGICFRASGKNILLTSDTGWTFETAFKNQSLLSKNGDKFEKIHVLVSHIGSILRKEFDLATKPDIQESFYGNHLGILGTICSIEQWKPDLCIISEFGEELVSIREEVVNEIGKVSKDINPGMNCFPGDVGLFILFTSKQMVCYATEDIVGWDKMVFSDADDKGANSIKYYKDGSLQKRVAAKIKKNFLESIRVEQGINIIREYYQGKILNDYQIYNKTLPGILDEIKKASVDTTSEISKEETTRFISSRLMYLTCLDNGKELISSCIDGDNNFELINQALNQYYIDKDIILNLKRPVGAVV